MSSAIIYARVSDPSQAEEGVSIESQVSAGQRKAEQLGLEVVRVFRDEGLSGRTTARPAFLAALDFCAAMQITHFIVWSTSRFARNKLDAALTKRTLRKGGTELVYCSIDIDPSTDEGWMFEGLSELWDEYHSRMISKDTKRSMITNATNGYWNGGQVPLGYRSAPAADGKRRRLQVNEDEAPIVREVFSMYLLGDGVKAIAKALNDRGMTRRGARWSKGVVTATLRNHVYTGAIAFNRTAGGKPRPRAEWILTASHDPIIDQEQFARANALLAKRAVTQVSRRSPRRFVFTGLLKCEACGRTMQSESAQGRSRAYHYYNCRSAQSGIGCSNRRIAADDFDAWLVDEIADRLLTPARVTELVSSMREVVSQAARRNLDESRVIGTELRTLAQRRKNLLEVLELHGQAAPNMADLAERLRELTTRIAALRTRLATATRPAARQADIDPAAAATFFRRVLSESGNAAKLRAFIGSFVAEIIVTDTAAEVVYQPDRIIGAANPDAVRMGVGWLPDQGSNLGPAD